MINKKAAMFGLDARIALAIFGALSVITGVALYSAISNAKATALLADMNEIGKAWESYYLDTGINLPQSKTTPSTDVAYYILKASELAKNISNVKGWKGPYLSYEDDGSYLKYPKYLYARMLTLTDDESWGETHWADGSLTSVRCPASSKCYLWVNIIGVEDNAPVITALDKKIDGSDGASKGSFRWHEGNLADWETRIYLKYAPIKNPND